MGRLRFFIKERERQQGVSRCRCVLRLVLEPEILTAHIDDGQRHIWRKGNFERFDDDIVNQASFIGEEGRRDDCMIKRGGNDAIPWNKELV
jgi:hypothetical protein